MRIGIVHGYGEPEILEGEFSVIPAIGQSIKDNGRIYLIKNIVFDYSQNLVIIYV